MNKWTLLATVSLVAVLGVCYTLLSRQTKHGFPAGEAAEEMDSEDDGMPDKSESALTTDDDASDASSRVAAAKPPLRIGGSKGVGVETLEDDEENGVTVEAGEVLDDDEGVLEPASPASDADAATPTAPAHDGTTTGKDDAVGGDERETEPY